jgi:hypothetical protein
VRDAGGGCVAPATDQRAPARHASLDPHRAGGAGRCQPGGAGIADACPIGRSDWGGQAAQQDILTLLYFAALRIRPAAPGHADRDIFIASQGTGAIALYARSPGTQPATR